MASLGHQTNFFKRNLSLSIETHLNVFRFWSYAMDNICDEITRLRFESRPTSTRRMRVAQQVVWESHGGRIAVASQL